MAQSLKIDLWHHGGSLQPASTDEQSFCINEQLQPEKPPARISASRIPGFLRPGQVLSPGPTKQRPDCCQGLGISGKFLKRLGLLHSTWNIASFPGFK
ncbi:hypothetical protein TNCV_1623451 [Trichonephila clavipes]|nr:hypothetical protein TNCV_1623451 [Trichonephila clavipes]